MRGIFITLEGGDGAGKTTQASLLEEWFQSQGRDVVRTREPGGTPLGVEIREMVLHSRGHIDERTEALLYAADRAQHIETLVRPALAEGKVVIQDRYFDSSVAYQGVARDLGADRVRGLSLWATRDLLPDLTILLDLSVEDGRARLEALGKRFDRLEAEAAAFHECVRQAFLDLAAAEPERFLVLDATQSPEALAAAIRERLEGSGVLTTEA